MGKDSCFLQQFSRHGELIRNETTLDGRMKMRRQVSSIMRLRREEYLTELERQNPVADLEELTITRYRGGHGRQIRR
jgi:hypothetical protein